MHEGIHWSLESLTSDTISTLYGLLSLHNPIVGWTTVPMCRYGFSYPVKFGALQIILTVRVSEGEQPTEQVQYSFLVRVAIPAKSSLKPKP